MPSSATKKFISINRLHFFDENYDEYIGTKNRKIYIKKKEKEFSLKLPLCLYDVFSFSRYLSRLFRLDRVNILAHGECFILVLRQKKIFYINLKEKTIVNTFKLNRTRNILFDSSVNINNQVLFGDYGINKINKIYKSNDNGMSWEIAHRFHENEFKQILKITWDKFEEKYWVLCGDEIGESKFVIFDKNFNKVNEFFDNSLKFRAITIYFYEDEISWITNDPYSGSKSYTMSRKTNEVKMNSSIEGSVWYSTITSDGLIIVATVAENIKFDNPGLVKIYSSNNFIKWKLETTFKKDWLSKKFFRYGIASFPNGNFSSKNVYINFEAIKRHDGKVINFKY